ncbi:MAG: SpoVR family protein [Peptococcaceae bacterium]|nr:SpoVR family protein [Peptococcaceae bacterium]
MTETCFLEKVIDEIMAKAEELGLDFYEMRFEICPAEILYTFGACGMPTRFSHWSFGKAFQRIKKEYDYNLSRIYELVINSDPCYAFLLQDNTLVENKLVVAHVLAHCDFFKNNAYFALTPPDKLSDMEASAVRIREYESRYGRDEVEAFLDAVLSIKEHIDPHRLVKNTTTGKPPPAGPQKDLLLYIMHHAHYLEDWQRDIIGIIRDEMLYFWPLMETKITNEGWATFWHLRIIRSLDLSEKEVVEFAKMHAGLLQPSRWQLNPYLVGLRIWQDIEKRYGREALFELRSYTNDLSLIRNYLNEDLVQELDLYVYANIGQEWRVLDRSWQNVRDTIVNNLVNCGHPVIYMEDGNFNNRGELYLRHAYEGAELDIDYLENTLPFVYKLWGRPVHLETVVDEKVTLFSYQGERVSRRFVKVHQP